MRHKTCRFSMLYFARPKIVKYIKLIRTIYFFVQGFGFFDLILTPSILTPSIFNSIQFIIQRSNRSQDNTYSVESGKLTASSVIARHEATLQ